ncbi:hypothetical protein Fmac_020206 [Flemingia macrophylla]|uniref:Major facilitator superfamily (MFS) profile domain-containing protein n=1 Tax=Flemingia macrophylla TaxID=520843 RepID=A0ABD1LTC5_9FABA
MASKMHVGPFTSRSPPLILICTCSFPIAPPVLVFRLFSSCRAVLVVFLLLRFFGYGHPLVFLQSKSSGRVLCLSWLMLGLGRLRKKRWMWLGLGLGIRVRNCLWMIWYIVERWMGKRMNRMEEGAATAQSVETMIIGRLLVGISIGVASAIVPLYISEELDVCLARKGVGGGIAALFSCGL